MQRSVYTAILFFISLLRISAQDSLSVSQESAARPFSDSKLLSGFVRGGFYSWVDKTDNKLYLPDVFSDLALKLDAGKTSAFTAHADLRYRYGTEFTKPVSRFELKEAFIRTGTEKWDIALGQKIIKWGRCDFTNPVSKFSPRNYVSRSPDREDMDMGNLLAEFNWYTSRKINFQAVVVPCYRSSDLMTDLIPLPRNVALNNINNLITDKKMFSYGIKADFNLTGINGSLSWFDGYDPVPGIQLTRFTIDLGQATPSTYTELSMQPYKTRVLGADFETTAGDLGIRGEAAWSFPSLSYKSYEFSALPEISWVAGFDWFSGNWHFTAEYNGKYMTRFTPVSVEPLLGSQPDYSQLAAMLSDPAFDLHEYVRQEVSAFNRLYNYQIYRYYHAAGFKIDTEFSYGRILPSVFTMYNFTSRDLLVIPEIKIKPADGLSITAGAEIYSGRKGSLYELVKDFMNGAYVSLRVDF